MTAAPAVLQSHVLAAEWATVQPPTGGPREPRNSTPAVPVPVRAPVGGDPSHRGPPGRTTGAGTDALPRQQGRVSDPGGAVRRIDRDMMPSPPPGTRGWPLRVVLPHFVPLPSLLLHISPVEADVPTGATAPTTVPMNRRTLRFCGGKRMRTGSSRPLRRQWTPSKPRTPRARASFIVIRPPVS